MMLPFLIVFLYALPGLLILIKKQSPPFPVGKTHIVRGRDAKVIGIAMMIPAVVSLMGLAVISTRSFIPSQVEQVTVFLEIFVDTLLFISAIYVLMTTIGARSDSEEKPKRKRGSLPDALTVHEAALYLSLDDSDILNLIKDGDLRAKRSSNGYQISREAFETYLDS